MKIRVSEIRVKRIRVNQGLGVPSLLRNLMNTSLVLDDAICTFMQVNFKCLELTQIHRFQWTTALMRLFLEQI